MKKELMKMMSLILMMSGLSSCVQTDVVANDSEEAVDEIVLRLAGPEESVGTRADATHKLRYVAKLFEGDNIFSEGRYKGRAEIIEGENNNTVKFKVEPGTYTVLLFADYIPASSEKREDGTYADNYYNTQSKNEHIELIDFETVKSNPINNDSYDCFSYRSGEIVKEKDKAAILDKKVLKRAVAKVRFLATGEPSLDNFNLTVSKLSCYSLFFQTDGVFLNGKPDNLLKTNVDFNSPTNASEYELFYFYTLAQTQESKLKAIEFTVQTGDKIIQTKIAADVLPVKSNQITTVKGQFAYVEPEIPEDRDEDYLFVTDMSTDNTWSTETPSFSDGITITDITPAD